MMEKIDIDGTLEDCSGRLYHALDILNKPFEEITCKDIMTIRGCGRKTLYEFFDICERHNIKIDDENCHSHFQNKLLENKFEPDLNQIVITRKKVFEVIDFMFRDYILMKPTNFWKLLFCEKLGFPKGNETVKITKVAK